MALGDRIKQARSAKKISMRALAEQVGVSAMAISKYERGLNTPNSTVLLNLAQALDVRVEFFFRPTTVTANLHAYRKHASLGAKDEAAITARIHEWVERYLEVEELLDLEPEIFSFKRPVSTLEDVEDVATALRKQWQQDQSPIENLEELLEDKGIKVGIVDGFAHFDACTFSVNDGYVIVTKGGVPGDRQRFNITHELGHLVIDDNEQIDNEKIAKRFAGAFLVPKVIVYEELGTKRTTLDTNELYILKHKYGLSMQAWIFRALDLNIISKSTGTTLWKKFRTNGWHRREPGKPYPSETPTRMQLLIHRLLAEDVISRSRAEELLGKPLRNVWTREVLESNVSVLGTGH